MEDLIRRSDAIKAVKRISENYGGKGKRDYHPHIDFIVDELMYALPSADRPQGEWIYTDNPLRLNDEWECNKCGYLSFTKANYCGHCGARMKGATDGNK